jgi:hypothetical protein
MFATRGVRLGVCSMLAVVWTESAFAWGPQAHRVIARVAEERLSAPAKAAIRELLIPPDTLPDVAGWADKEGHDAVPGSAKWHFINVPIGDARFDARLIRDENNVVVKIKQYRPLDDAPKIIPRGYMLGESYLATEKQGHASQSPTSGRRAVSQTLILTRHPATDRSQPPRAGELLCRSFRTKTLSGRALRLSAAGRSRAAPQSGSFGPSLSSPPCMR